MRGKRWEITNRFPGKVDAMGGAVNLSTRRLNDPFSIINCQFSRQRPFLPFLQITHQTVPGTVACGLEHLFVVGRLSRFEQEHLDEGTRMLAVGSCLAEVHTGLDHLRIVKHHQRSLRQVVGQVIKDILPYLTFIINKEFGLVAARHRELGDTLVGQVILIVADVDMSRIGH